MQDNIENLDTEQLAQKLRVAAQVCTHSLAVVLRNQPRHRFYPKPPSTSAAAASTLRAAPISSGHSPGEEPATQSPGQAESAAEKAPFKKGKWKGTSREVEGLLNRAGRQPVNDGPVASRAARAQGYQRMRAPQQARCATFPLSPHAALQAFWLHSPCFWP